MCTPQPLQTQTESASASTQVHTLEYVTALQTEWTHLLKTDDDCYVRMRQVIGSLQASSLSTAHNIAGSKYLPVKQPVKQ